MKTIATVIEELMASVLNGQISQAQTQFKRQKKAARLAILLALTSAISKGGTPGIPHREGTDTLIVLLKSIY